MTKSILYIDDSPAIWDEPILPGKSLYELAKDIKDNHSDRKIILINAHFIFSHANAPEKYDYLQHCAGIDLLKMLRLLRETRHCVLYSPMSITELLRLKPGNLIITSKGVTCVQRYSDSEKDKYDGLESVLTGKSPLGDLGAEKNQAPFPFPKEYFKADFQMPEDNRHDWANWWGIRQLCQIHSGIDGKMKVENDSISYNENEFTKVNGKLKKLESQKAISMYGISLENIRAAWRNIKQKEEKARKNKEEHSAIIEALYSPILQKLNGSSYFEKYRTSEGFGFKYWAALTDYDEASDDSQKTEILKKKFYEDLKQLSQLHDNLFKLFQDEEKSAHEKEEEKCNLITKAITNAKSKIEEKSIADIKTILKSRCPKIFFIDDQAKDGWSEIFQLMIYNEISSENFTSIIPARENINAYYVNDDSTHTENDITEYLKHADLVLLDLRLEQESGIRQDVEELSGAKLLSKIKEIFPGLPVMMVTASNKSWSYEELQRLGSDAMWTKEGLDSRMKECESAQNYCRFIELVEKLTGGEYKFLKWFANEIEEIKKSEKDFWWEKVNTTINNNAVKREDIIQILQYSLFISRKYIQNEVINPNKGKQTTEWLLPSLMVHNLGKIPELIYGTWEREKINDKIGKELYEVRNNASHIVRASARKSVKEFTFHDSNGYSQEMMKYLNLKSPPPIVAFTEVDPAVIGLSKEEINRRVEESNKKKKEKGARKQNK